MHPSDLSIKKTALRKEIRLRKALYDQNTLRVWSDDLCRKLEAHKWFQAAKVVLLYASLPDEVDTHSLLKRWHTQKTLLLPVVEGDSLVLRRYEAATQLRPNQWQIEEPEGENFDLFDTIDLAVIPGMAFDAEGHRLGRGKGFYDRLLPLLHCPTIGLCFPFQKVNTLPTDSWDKSVDEVL